MHALQKKTRFSWNVLVHSIKINALLIFRNALQNNLAPETHKQVPETRNQNNVKCAPRSAVAATADRHFGSGLNSSSGGELKLYLDWKRNTSVHRGVSVHVGGSLSKGGLCQGVPHYGKERAVRILLIIDLVLIICITITTTENVIHSYICCRNNYTTPLEDYYFKKTRIY